MASRKRTYQQTWSFSIGWTNPHTSPPEGMPRGLLHIEGRRRQVFELMEFAKSILYPHLTGSGYGILLANTTARKTWSAEKKAKARLKRQTRKFKEAFPMFWSEMLEADKAKRPSYYRGE